MLDFPTCEESRQARPYESRVVDSGSKRNCARRWRKRRISGTLKLNQEARLSDGVVIGFGLVLANLTMTQDLSLINRKTLVEQINHEVIQHLAELGDCDDDTRRAKIEMLIAGASEFSAYHPDSPLMAAASQGGTPS